MAYDENGGFLSNLGSAEILGPLIGGTLGGLQGADQEQRAQKRMFPFLGQAATSWQTGKYADPSAVARVAPESPYAALAQGVAGGLQQGQAMGQAQKETKANKTGEAEKVVGDIESKLKANQASNPQTFGPNPYEALTNPYRLSTPSFFGR